MEALIVIASATITVAVLTLVVLGVSLRQAFKKIKRLERTKFTDAERAKLQSIALYDNVGLTQAQVIALIDARIALAAKKAAEESEQEIFAEIAALGLTACMEQYKRKRDD